MSKRMITLLTVLVLLLTAAGCDLMSLEDTISVDAGSRSLVETESSENWIPFTAVVEVTQVPFSAVTAPNGKGGRYKTTGEILKGNVVSSDWEVLAGAQLEMDNTTDFRMIPEANGTFSIDGTNHSKITVSAADGSVMYMNANGKISGNLPFGAELDMNFNTMKSSGSQAIGSLSGAFVWYTLPPSGTIILSGYWKE